MKEVKGINVTMTPKTIHVDFKVSRLTDYMYPGLDDDTAETIQQYVPKEFKVTAKRELQGWFW